MNTVPCVKLGDLITDSKRENDGIDWKVIETKNILNQTKKIKKISPYTKEGQDKVFIGFDDNTAIATGSKPVMEQMEKLREALEMGEDELFTPALVEVTLAELKSRSGRTYLIFQ